MEVVQATELGAFRDGIGTAKQKAISPKPLFPILDSVRRPRRNEWCLVLKQMRYDFIPCYYRIQVIGHLNGTTDLK